MRLGAVMPTFQQVEHLGAAVDSVVGQVDDLVVVDDGCTDWTHAFLAGREDSRVRVVRHATNRGTAEAINTGRSHIHPDCDWLTWVSSDNVMEPNWRATLEAAIAPDVGAAYSAFWYEKPGHAPVVLFEDYDPAKQIAQEACYFGPSFIIRADVWQPHRGRISHDLDNWLRVEEACWAKGLRIVGIPTPLCHYNAHDKRVTVTRRHEYDAHLWQMEARRRRADAFVAHGVGA